MDMYRALNADVPQLLFTIMHQADPTISENDFTRIITALHMEIRDQMQAASQELHQWLQQQYSLQAEETVRKLQRHTLLSDNANIEQVQEILERDFSRLSSRTGSESLLGLQGSADQFFNDESPLDLDLARRVAVGREYLSSLGFKPGWGILHETWLSFRGSLHYDLIEHIVRNRMSIYKRSNGDQLEYMGHTAFGTWNLVYQLGESLTADLTSDTGTQEVTFAFNKGPIQYSPFRQEVSALMEQVAEQVDLLHASFWQRKMGLSSGQEFVLRLRLAVGEIPLQEIINVIESTGHVGKETIVERGKLLLGKRVL
ncbi:MAG TPA: hypothetical protein VF043_07145 [Ktedonobacteraceae bacterium]